MNGVSSERAETSGRSWAVAWREALEATGASAARRVQRGQALARRGAVGELRLEPGRIEASVQESHGHREQVRFVRELPDDATWDAAIDVLASELRFTAALLDGHVTDPLAEAMAAAGIDLVPAVADLAPRCTCPERATVCRHVAAVHEAAGVLIGRSPTLLLRLAGRDVEDVLRSLRRDARGAGAALAETVDLAAGLEQARGDLDAIELHPIPVTDPGALVRQLGPPPGMADTDALEDLVAAAAETAWRLAAGDGADAADEELLVAELRARRMASAPDLAAALGREVEAVRTELDRLFEAGDVMRTGSGERARYRAADA